MDGGMTDTQTSIEELEGALNALRQKQAREVMERMAEMVAKVYAEPRYRMARSIEQVLSICIQANPELARWKSDATTEVFIES